MSPASSLVEGGAAGLLGAEPSATDAVVGVEVEAVVAATTRSERLRSLGCIWMEMERNDFGPIFIVNPLATFSTRETCLCVFALAVDVVALRLRLRGGRARPRGGAAAAPVPLPAAARPRRRRLHVRRRRRGHRRRKAQSAFSSHINQTSQNEVPLLYQPYF